MSFSFTTDNSSQVLNNMNGASNATSVFITLSQSSNLYITSNTFNTQIANYLSLSGGTLTGILNGTTINATTLQQGGTGVSTLITNAINNYLPLTGGTLTGTLTGTTINATTNLQEGGTNLSTKYLTSNTISYYPLTSFMNTSIQGTSNNYQYYPLTSVMNASILSNSNNYQYYPLTSVMNASILSNSKNYQYYPLTSVMNASILSNSNNYQYYTLTSFMNSSIQGASNNFQYYLLSTQTSNIFVSSNVFNQKINATYNNFANYLPLTGGTLTGTLSGTTINASTNLQENGTNLSAKYLTLTGGTLTNTLNGTTINATTNLQEGGTNLSTKYLTSNNIALYPLTSFMNSSIQGASNNFQYYQTSNYNVLLMNNTSNYIKTLNQQTNNNFANYLPLSGGTLTGQITHSTSSGTNPIYITSTSTTANNCIQIKNNSTYTSYIGIGGTAFGGNYANNLFLESSSSSIIFNTNGRTSASTPNMIVHSSGYVGISTATPNTALDVNGVVNVNNGTTNTPQLGSYGGTGDRIVLWAGNGSAYPFSLGINGSTLWYSVPSGASHKFYNNGVNSLTIDSGSYTYTNGLRLNGTDTANTVYNASTDMGITVNSGKTINIGMFGGNGNIMTITNTKATITQPTQINDTLTIYPNTSTLNGINLYTYPNSINNTNGVNAGVNLNVVCNTTVTPASSAFINAVVADGWNGIDTIITLSSCSGANSGYNNASRIILDGSYATNSSKGFYGSTLNFQSQYSGGWQNNMAISTASGTTTISIYGDSSTSGTSTVYNLSCTNDINANTFITSTPYANNIILRTFQVLPALVGSGGYYLIDVYQYALGGYSYLNLSVSSTNFYWLGRVFIVSTSGIYFTNDWFNACSTGALSNSGRLCISITPTTSPITGQLMNVRIIG